MKWLVYILSLYILLLSCIPCNDAEGAVLPGTTYSSISAAHGAHNNTQDCCSPLCICSCCNVQATAGTLIYFTFFHRHVLIGYPALPVAPLSALSASIWQPPQLV